ncbi:MAG: hypothetical protein EOP50_15465 [Sphingobacteriales bacterium]|nr:MAG: hypothetical protein EOP50_15465 [Sphingobacteriales bacterium]
MIEPAVPQRQPCRGWLATGKQTPRLPSFVRLDQTLGQDAYRAGCDLARLQQKAVLVPTPGQGEQEYLAKHLMAKKLFYACEQNGFNLAQELNNAHKFYADSATIDCAMKESYVENWLEKIIHAKALQ